MLHSTEIGGDAYRRPSTTVSASDWDPSDEVRGGHWMAEGSGAVHSGERWTSAALQFLSERDHERPFFLHIAYHAPHDPRQAPRSFLEMYENRNPSIPPNFMDGHPFDNGELAVRDEHLAPHPRTLEAIRL